MTRPRSRQNSKSGVLRLAPSIGSPSPPPQVPRLAPDPDHEIAHLPPQSTELVQNIDIAITNQSSIRDQRAPTPSSPYAPKTPSRLRKTHNSSPLFAPEDAIKPEPRRNSTLSVGVVSPKQLEGDHNRIEGDAECFRGDVFYHALKNLPVALVPEYGQEVHPFHALVAMAAVVLDRENTGFELVKQESVEQEPRPGGRTASEVLAYCAAWVDDQENGTAKSIKSEAEGSQIMPFDDSAGYAVVYDQESGLVESTKSVPTDIPRMTSDHFKGHAATRNERDRESEKETVLQSIESGPGILEAASIDRQTLIETPAVAKPIEGKICWSSPLTSVSPTPQAHQRFQTPPSASQKRKSSAMLPLNPKSGNDDSRKKLKKGK